MDDSIKEPVQKIVFQLKGFFSVRKIQKTNYVFARIWLKDY